MVTVSVRKLQPNIDLSQASRHLEILHRDAAGLASLVLLGNIRHERHCFFAVNELRDEPDAIDTSCEALQDVVDARWNVYTACATFAAVPARGRGTRADVLEVPGVWADLDVKPDVESYFTSEQQIVRYVDCLPRPTLEVASGSGGRHLYWLTHQRLDAKNGQDLLLKWLDFLRAEATGMIIENVHDTTRILRLAGTVRWPKINDATALPQPVEIVREGPRYHAEELMTLTNPAHEAAKQRRDELRAQRHTLEEKRHNELSLRGLRVENYERVVRMFNAQQDWGPLLESTGWTLHSDQRDGVARCRYWTRPGKKPEDGKSASTDFTGDDGTVSRLMTLYTNDPSLHDICEFDDTSAVSICTKWSYAVHRLFDGDEATLLRCVVRNRGRLV